MNTNRFALVLLFGFLLCGTTFTVTAAEPGFKPVVQMTAEQDRAEMMKQLGLVRLRPGPSGDEKAPNHANYNESLANPCPELPEVLKLENGKPVTSAEQWWKKRRPELVEAFEREVYGRVPAEVPAVKWSVDVTDYEFVGRTPVVARQLTGHVDNSCYPLIDVNIRMLVVLPLNVRGPVPVLMMFGRPTFPAPAQPMGEDMDKINAALRELLVKTNPELKDILARYPLYAPAAKLPGPNYFAPAPDGNSAPTEQLLAAGWGYATLDPSSVQADNGAGLTKGIIGLVNQGQPRKPDDWGSLRAWAWGAARALDYLETDSLVDARKVGIEGVSRYGKAALVTMAFEPRFAVGLIGSSGKGGAALHRRVFGEAVESLTSSGEYHWMAGNYLKYAASEAKGGAKTGCDLPVDSHELLALAAPRSLFISYGIPEKGDSRWLDQQGSFMAAVAAGKVYRLLGAKDLGLSDDYLKEAMPPMLNGLLDGSLAWRQHDGGHTDAPNVQFFIPWANRELKYTRKTIR